jgi:hypothetical protein
VKLKVRHAARGARLRPKRLHRQRFTVRRTRRRV